MMDVSWVLKNVKTFDGRISLKPNSWVHFMKENPTASDWVATRGEKWRAQAAGMEATIQSVDEPLIRALHLDVACRIADIGCGGGRTTLEILRHAPMGSLVHWLRYFVSLNRVGSFPHAIR